MKMQLYMYLMKYVKHDDWKQFKHLGLKKER